MKPIKDHVRNLIFLKSAARNNRDTQKAIAREKADFERLEGVSLVASSCLAGEIYSILGMPFLSPTINSSINRLDFVDFCIDLPRYMECEMVYAGRVSGCVRTKLVDSTGALRDIKFSWPHETNPNKIIADFDKRRARINYSKLVFLTDCNDFGLKTAEEFNRLDCMAKALFVPQGSVMSSLECAIEVPGYHKTDQINNFQYMQKSGLYEFQEKWDYVDWLNSHVS